jgi:hypothetical protein
MRPQRHFSTHVLLGLGAKRSRTSKSAEVSEEATAALRLFEIGPLPSGLLGLIVVRAITVPKGRTSPQGASRSRPVIPIRNSAEQSIASRRQDPRLAALKILHFHERLRQPGLPNVRKEGARTEHGRDRDDSIFVDKHGLLSFA